MPNNWYKGGIWDGSGGPSTDVAVSELPIILSELCCAVNAREEALGRGHAQEDTSTPWYAADQWARTNGDWYDDPARPALLGYPLTRWLLPDGSETTYPEPEDFLEAPLWWPWPVASGFPTSVVPGFHNGATSYMTAGNVFAVNLYRLQVAVTHLATGIPLPTRSAHHLAAPGIPGVPGWWGEGNPQMGATWIPLSVPYQARFVKPGTQTPWTFAELQEATDTVFYITITVGGSPGFPGTQISARSYYPIDRLQSARVWMQLRAFLDLLYEVEWRFTPFAPFGGIQFRSEEKQGESPYPSIAAGHVERRKYEDLIYKGGTVFSNPTWSKAVTEPYAVAPKRLPSPNSETEIFLGLQDFDVHAWPGAAYWLARAYDWTRRDENGNIVDSGRNQVYVLADKAFTPPLQTQWIKGELLKGIYSVTATARGINNFACPTITGRNYRADNSYFDVVVNVLPMGISNPGPTASETYEEDRGTDWPTIGAVTPSERCEIVTPYPNPTFNHGPFWSGSAAGLYGGATFGPQYVSSSGVSPLRCYTDISMLCPDRQ